MKKSTVGSLFASFIILNFIAGCSTTPTQVYLGDINDGGIHSFSQAPEKWVLIYNKRVLNSTARDIQEMDMAYRKAGVAVEQLGNLQEIAKKNGISEQQLQMIIAAMYWDSIQKPQGGGWVSSGYQQSGYYGGPAFGLGNNFAPNNSGQVRGNSVVRSPGYSAGSQSSGNNSVVRSPGYGR